MRPAPHGQRQSLAGRRRKRPDDAAPIGRGSSAPTTRWPAIASRDRDGQQRPPTAEDDEAVAGLLDVGDDVRREQRGRARRPNGIDEDLEELAAGERIEARQRLVEEEDRRPRAQRERQPDLRLLSPRQLVGAGIKRNREVVEVAAGERRGRSLGGETAANARWSSTVSSR